MYSAPSRAKSKIPSKEIGELAFSSSLLSAVRETHDHSRSLTPITCGINLALSGIKKRAGVRPVVSIQLIIGVGSNHAKSDPGRAALLKFSRCVRKLGLSGVSFNHSRLTREFQYWESSP